MDEHIPGIGRKWPQHLTLNNLTRPVKRDVSHSLTVFNNSLLFNSLVIELCIRKYYSEGKHTSLIIITHNH